MSPASEDVPDSQRQASLMLRHTRAAGLADLIRCRHAPAALATEQLAPDFQFCRWRQALRFSLPVRLDKLPRRTRNFCLEATSVVMPSISS